MLFSEWASGPNLRVLSLDGCWEERLLGANQPWTSKTYVVMTRKAIRKSFHKLESKGYHCTAVSNGRAAQDQVKRTTPDLVLSDMIMPK